MKLLILGGTKFLGRYLAEIALERGHEVSLFNRGRTGPDLFPEAEKLRGEREGDLSVLRGRSWDSAIDTSGYLSRTVHASAGLLAGAVDHHTFVSSISAYPHPIPPGTDENVPVLEPPDLELEELDMKLYGELKVGCERAAKAEMPGRVLVVRPGLIVGTHDYTDRFAYWCRRMERDGEVLAPGDPERQVQLIDVRDLAGWMLRMAEERRTGVYNATGPRDILTMARMLEGIRVATGSDARFTWVPEEFLLESKVGPWDELPLWLPEEMNGMLAVSVGKAVHEGPTFRPIQDTARDTLAWEADRDDEAGTGAGISQEREEELLRIWRAGNGPG